MSAQDATTQVTAGALRLYPESGPADQSVTDQMQELWRFQRAFVVLSGPPGVGKTRAAEDFACEMLRERQAHFSQEECRITHLFPDYQTKTYADAEIDKVLADHDISFVWDIAVLHPQYAYEDLIRGVQFAQRDTGTPTLFVREGILGFISRVTTRLARQHDSSDISPRGLLILDEINRAPIGQLFGEAIHALDRRGSVVATPHKLEGVGSDFWVPPELFLVGTMNSVDRAVSGIDFALKRRFANISIPPKIEPLRDRYQNNPAARSIAEQLFISLKELVVSSPQGGLVSPSELILGHSFFIAPDNLGKDEEIIDWLSHSCQYQVIPTLVDYQEQGLIQYDAQKASGSVFYDFIAGHKSLADATRADIRERLKSLSASSVPDRETGSRSHDE
jgi:DNA polymerase III delta prime subunit